MIKVQDGTKDKWSYIWGNNTFSSQNAYKVMIGHLPAPQILAWVWKPSCQAKHKFFFWLLVHDILNTMNFQRRK
jgi:hypothetical protein